MTEWFHVKDEICQPAQLGFLILSQTFVIVQATTFVLRGTEGIFPCIAVLALCPWKEGNLGAFILS